MHASTMRICFETDASEDLRCVCPRKKPSFNLHPACGMLTHLAVAASCKTTVIVPTVVGHFGQCRVVREAAILKKTVKMYLIPKYVSL